MKNKIIIFIYFIFISITFCSCEPYYKELKFGVLPDELKDCKTFYLSSEDGNTITVMRCPNSTTSSTYRVGKHTATTVVIDGVEYVKKEETSNLEK